MFKHHQAQPALRPTSSRDWPLDPGTSGVSSTSISVFNTIRISTTNQIRQVVGTCLQLAWKHLLYLQLLILTSSSGIHCLDLEESTALPASSVCAGMLTCAAALPHFAACGTCSRRLGWRWWDCTLLVPAQHPHISLPWLLKNLLTGLIFTGAGLRNKMMRNFSCLCWCLPKLMLLLCFSHSFLAVN